MLAARWTHPTVHTHLYLLFFIVGVFSEWLELRRLPQILFYVVARMVIFKSRNQLQKATRRKVTMLL
jgi:hypothetical protein